MTTNYESKFLGSQGLTSAEANYTANIVKELCERISVELKSMSLFSGILHFNGQEKSYVKQSKVDNLKDKCMEEGNLYALSAWLREAIKTKDNFISKSQTDNFTKELKPNPTYPSLENIKTEEMIKYTLPIDELGEYLSYEAKAAHIGKKVHPNGIFDKWFTEIKNTPTVQLHPDNKDYVITLTQVVLEEDLYKVYFELQKEYREAEQKVNYYKAKVKNMWTEEASKVNSRNSVLVEEYAKELKVISSENAILQKEIDNLRLEKGKELSDLKIIIPKALQPTLEFIQTYSKK